MFGIFFLEKKKAKSKSIVVESRERPTPQWGPEHMRQQQQQQQQAVRYSLGKRKEVKRAECGGIGTRNIEKYCCITHPPPASDLLVVSTKYLPGRRDTGKKSVCNLSEIVTTVSVLLSNTNDPYIA